MKQSGEEGMTKLISIGIGALITLMITLNGTLSASVGNYTASVIIHFLGLVATIFIVIITKSKFKVRNNLVWYLYSAGAIGIFTVLFNNLGFSALGVSLTVSLGLLGQTISSIIIDHFGLMGMQKIRFEKKKIMGLLFIMAGIAVMIFY